MTGEAIRATTKVTIAVTVTAISTAASARGTRCRSRNVAAGDSMVPVTKAITTGRKNGLPR